MILRQIPIILLLTTLLTACGTASTPQPTAEPTPEPEQVEATAEVTPELSEVAQAGQVLYEQFYQEAGFSCLTCHYINSDNRLLGPGLLSIEDRFDTYDVEADDLESYIRASITNPRDFIVPDESPYPDNIMPDMYDELFTDDELDALVEYILSF